MKISLFVAGVALFSSVTLAAEPQATQVGAGHEAAMAKVAIVPQRPIVEVRIRGTVDDNTLRTLRSAFEGAYPSRAVFIEERPDGGITLLVM